MTVQRSKLRMNQNILEKAVLDPLGAAPGTPSVGQMYFDTTGGVLRALWWNGTAWTNDATHLGGQNGAYYLARANHTGTQAAATISDLATVVQAYRLDQFAAPTASVNFNNQKITSLGTPTLAGDAVTKAYVDSMVSGLVVKQAVRAASTANVAVTYTAAGGASSRGQITTAPNTLDGVALAPFDRLLLKNQATGAQNGIWVVTTLGTGANGVWDRATDYDADAEVTAGSFSFVTEGTANGDTGWVLTTNNPITIGGAGGTALTYAQFTSSSTYTAGSGLVLVGSDFRVGAGTGITVNADDVQIDTAVVARKGSTLLAGSSLTYTVAHGGAVNSVFGMTVIEVATGDVVDCDLTVDATNITVGFGTAPATNTYRLNWVF